MATQKHLNSRTKSTGNINQLISPEQPVANFTKNEILHTAMPPQKLAQPVNWNLVISWRFKLSGRRLEN
jgi:hypothetical protein